jgi:phosphoribosylaminoimidazole-succinocarboxamide synthase
MLCQISNFWFAQTEHIVQPPHRHRCRSVLPVGVDAALYTRRSVVTKRLKPVPVECIARLRDRQRLEGSAHWPHQRHRPARRTRQAEKLPNRSSPVHSAAVGDTMRTSTDTVAHGRRRLAEQVRDATLRLYSSARLRGATRHPAGRYRSIGTDSTAACT